MVHLDQEDLLRIRIALEAMIAGNRHSPAGVAANEGFDATLDKIYRYLSNR
jgi:hypothetical protein